MHTPAPERGSRDASARLNEHGLSAPSRQLALVALTFTAGMLWLGRASQVGPRFSFLWWNLFLAWVPWLLSLAMTRARRTFWPLAFTWLAFWPNAPYLVTDLIHLKPRAGVPLWFDALLLCAFAWAGCALGWDSLFTVHRVLERKWGARRAALAVTTCVGLCGVGVFLGRFERLNSWDVVTDPLGVATTSLDALMEPKAVVFSAAFALFVGAGYLFTRPRVLLTSS